MHSRLQALRLRLLSSSVGHTFGRKFLLKERNDHQNRASVAGQAEPFLAVLFCPRLQSLADTRLLHDSTATTEQEPRFEGNKGLV